jgi:hypothetical protein
VVLTWRQGKLDGTSFGVDHRMDLGGQASSGAAHSAVVGDARRLFLGAAPCL